MLCLSQGYYVKNNMLGPDGDFVTSPEISQVFGEVRLFFSHDLFDV